MNDHLQPIFLEVLPALTAANIRYWVIGGVAVAGIAGKFVRENQDIDVYVLEEDFPKTEPILKKLVEEHGGWDADHWDLRYSMLKTTSRPKFDIFIDSVERFSVVPIYPTQEGFEFRFAQSLKLPTSAIEQEKKAVAGLSFFSPPQEVIKTLLTFLIERYIAHRDPTKPINMNSKYLIDARIVFSEDEVKSYLQRLGVGADEQ